MALRSRFPEYVEAVTRPVGRGIGRTGITPNWLTTFGLLLTGAATWAVANDELLLGGWLLIAGAIMDLLDGAVARATGRTTPFGGFYDSVSDRISDGAILAAIAWHVSDQPRVFAAAVAALVAAQVTSYVRAKAEAIDLTCSIGILERGERAILLIAALLFHRWLLEPVLWLLALGGTVTVIQRIHHVWCQIDRDIPDELLELVMADRAWSRAFTRAARRFYGQRNFDGAVDTYEANGTADDHAGPTIEMPRPSRSVGRAAGRRDRDGGADDGPGFAP